MEEYIVYVRTDSGGIITEINSSAFISGEGDKYHHAQGPYLEHGLADAGGIYNYKLVGGVPVLRTDEDKAPEHARMASQAEISRLKRNLADTDYISAKIAEGAATKEEYADKLAERAGWRARINELEQQINGGSEHENN